jgi:hypothetical protein
LYASNAMSISVCNVLRNRVVCNERLALLQVHSMQKVLTMLTNACIYVYTHLEY